jgi:lambda family phage portal protein
MNAQVVDAQGFNAQVFGPDGDPIPSSAIAAVRASASWENPAYRAASLHAQDMAAWRPQSASADSAVLPDREIINARAQDLVRNDPHAAAGVTRLVDMLIGAGLLLSAKPDARALGLDPSTEQGRAIARQLGDMIESEFRIFSEDPLKRSDAQRRLSLNGMWRLLARTWVTSGECAAFMTWKKGWRYATALRVVDPDRLSNPNGLPPSQRLRGGIEFDGDGAPIAYHVRNAHAADWYASPQNATWTRIPRATSWGRPVFVHGFEPDRADQSRGVTLFASLMSRLRMIGKFADNELAAAAVNALFAAFVKSNMSIEAATQAFTPQTATFADKRIDYWKKYPPMLGGVRIPVLPLGDEIQINSSPRQTTAYPMFQAAFLQSIASALGISYEQLSMDWSKTNYSSARAALNEVWRHVQSVLAAFIEQVVTPVYFAVMEEAFDRGYIVPPKGAPDFWEIPAAYLRARWIGPGRGYVDPVKEANAATTRMVALMSTLEDECAAQGLDFEATLDQIAAEEAMLKERGLTRASVMPHLNPAQSEPDRDENSDRRADNQDQAA